LVGLILVVWLGFEAPNDWILWPSVAMTLATPLGIVGHLLATRTLTPARKRIWWQEFASARVWSALAEYLTTADLAASADRRSEEARERLELSEM
jgi:hypothetical protein